MRAIRKHVQLYCTELTFYFGPSKEIKQNPNATDGWKTEKKAKTWREKERKANEDTDDYLATSFCFPFGMFTHTHNATDVLVCVCVFSHHARARRASKPSSSTSLDNFRGWRIMITANTANITVEIQITILYRGDVKYRVYTVRYSECGTELCSRINMDSEVCGWERCAKRIQMRIKRHLVRAFEWKQIIKMNGVGVCGSKVGPVTPEATKERAKR